MITDYTSCTITGWMTSKYSLTGVSLIIYAILFGKSQGQFTCPVNWEFIYACTGLNPKEVELFLQSFQDRGLIEYDGVFYKTINGE